MKPVFILLALIGILLALAGSVFTLQGFGYVGPQSSLMFDSPAWISQGVIVAAIGLLMVSTAVVLDGRKKTAV